VSVCTDLLFKLFDVNESGNVTYEELQLGLGKLGCVHVCMNVKAWVWLYVCMCVWVCVGVCPCVSVSTYVCV
jgi:hypothetical protein